MTFLKCKLYNGNIPTFLTKFLVKFQDLILEVPNHAYG